MSRIRVVIAEDFTTVRMGLIALLSRDEVLDIVGDAANGQELIELVARLPKPPDVAVLDINMPVLDGHDTVLALKKLYPDMCFVMLSQHAADFTVVRMLLAGANAFLHKDADPKDVIDAIKAVQKEQFHYSGLFTKGLIQSLQRSKRNAIQPLTRREEEFLRLCTTEMRYKEIAARMGIAESTAIAYREQLCGKLGVKSRTGLAMAAFHLGLLNDEGHSKTIFADE